MVIPQWSNIIRKYRCFIILNELVGHYKVCPWVCRWRNKKRSEWQALREFFCLARCAPKDAIGDVAGLGK